MYSLVVSYVPNAIEEDKPLIVKLCFRSLSDLGCLLEDIEILGGDLTIQERGEGFQAPNDDDCSRECENNAACE